MAPNEFPKPKLWQTDWSDMSYDDKEDFDGEEFDDDWDPDEVEDDWEEEDDFEVI